MVALVGIAATTILFTLQPVFAASNIVARQLPSVNTTNIPASCRGESASGCAALSSLSNITDFNQSLCNATLVNNMESCFQCAVNASALTQSDVDTIISGYLEACALAKFTVTGVSSTPPSTGTASSTAASTSASSDASNLSMSAFGIIITSILGTIALL